MTAFVGMLNVSQAYRFFLAKDQARRLGIPDRILFGI
jgi:hypothetical protein